MLTALKYILNGREERVVLTEICRTSYIHDTIKLHRESSVSKAAIVSRTPVTLGACVNALLKGTKEMGTMIKYTYVMERL